MRVFPDLGCDRMALKLSGTDDHLTRQDFLALARTIYPTFADANAAMSEPAGRVHHADFQQIGLNADEKM